MLTIGWALVMRFYQIPRSEMSMISMAKKDCLEMAVWGVECLLRTCSRSSLAVWVVVWVACLAVECNSRVLRGCVSSSYESYFVKLARLISNRAEILSTSTRSLSKTCTRARFQNSHCKRVFCVPSVKGVVGRMVPSRSAAAVMARA